MNLKKSKRKNAKYQHYIPKFILKRFLDSTSFKLYDKKTKRFIKKGASNSMGKDLFYEHSKFQPNEMEDLLQSRESIYAPIIKSVIDGKQLNFKEFTTLLEFRHVHHYRSYEFFSFHTYGNRRGPNSYEQRHDWRSLNGIYGAMNQKELEKAIKLSQLNAMKSVINNDDKIGNVVRKLSEEVPFCFVYTSKGTKFIVPDSGSITFGGEFDGMTIIVISPTKAICFPKIEMALEILSKLSEKRGMKIELPLIVYCDLTDDVVDKVNRGSIEWSSQYYVDPN